MGGDDTTGRNLKKCQNLGTARVDCVRTYVHYDPGQIDPVRRKFFTIMVIDLLYKKNTTTICGGTIYGTLLN